MALNGKKHHNWKEKGASYRAIHQWLAREFGEPSHCRLCGSTRAVQWANRTGKLVRRRDNWIRLCGSCHRKFDSQQHEITLRARGVTMTLREWAEETGHKYNTLYVRLRVRGWPPERVVR